MNSYIISLSYFDQAKIAFSSVDLSDFVGILTPYLERNGLTGDYILHASLSNRSWGFYYGHNEMGSFIAPNGLAGSPKFYLSKERSKCGYVMDLTPDNRFMNEYNAFKSALTGNLKRASD